MELIKTLFDTLMSTNKMLAYMHAGTFILVFIAVFLIVTYLINHNWFAKKMAKFKNDVKKQEELRNEEYRKRSLLEGDFEGDSRMYKLRKMRNESGLKNKFPELNASNFILTIILLCGITGLIVFIITKAAIISLGAAAIMGILVFVYMQVSINRNYINTENEIVKFINMLDNVSSSENTIGEMLHRTAPYLKDPLRSMTEECYSEIKTDGNVPLALKHMADKANHKKLKQILNSLKSCATHNENYSEVIEDNRESIRAYIMFKKEERNIIKNALFETVILAIAGVVMVYMVGTMVDNAINIVFHTLPGQIILAGLLLIILIEIMKLMKQSR